ncbi:MAG: peptidoglycan DD-metalloendopeptidase family protein [Patescibacteria group bacterium]|nr:peptidoglycan DD-metalloendopeptidase family protein [Patescibacteria group bacterium]
MQEFGEKTLFSKLVSPDINRDTVEGVETISRYKEYRQEIGVLKAGPIFADKDNVETEAKISTAEGGTALVKSTLPDTTATGTPRKKVDHYQVKGGDTVSTIAAKFGISTNTILWANDLSSSDYIKPGQTLTIPPTSGVLYKVKSGDTVASLAKKYEANESKILEYNQLADASAIEEGQQIMIPGGYIEPPKPKPTTTSTFASVFSSSAPPSARVPATSRLLWPTTGRKISQYYKWGHRAIDITGNYSSPIYASEAGTITRVGWGRGYGNVVTISHGGGKQTLYAHLSKFYVRNGQQVSKGQTIGMMGCTGWCTGTHVHFEVLVNGSKVNPLSYL